MDFSLTKKSGLTQTEFAMLCGVSRVSVNLWHRGKMKPNREIQAKVTARLALLQYALDKGYLPIPKEPDAAARKATLARVLMKTAEEMKQSAKDELAA